MGYVRNIHAASTKFLSCWLHHKLRLQRPMAVPQPLPRPTIRQLRTPASTPGTALLSKPRIPLKDIQPDPIDW